MRKVLSLVVVAAMILTASMLVFADFEQGALVEAGNVNLTFQKANAAQTFDGIISEGEYYKVEVTPDMLSYATAAGVEDAKNMKWEAYASWDDTGVRTAVVYHIGTGDTGAFNNVRDEEQGNIWNSTAVQLSIATKSRGADTDYGEYGYGLSSVTGNQLSYVWHNADSCTNDAYAQDGQLPASDFKVTKVGNDLVYEIKTPWNAIGAPVAEGGSIGWCLVVAGGSENYGHCHAQIAAGCTGDPGKNADLFAIAKLAAAPVVETTTAAPAATDAPPAADVPAAPVAPAATADATVIMTVIAAVSAFGGAVVFKKRK